MVDRVGRRRDREITSLGQMLPEETAARLAVENQTGRLPTRDAPPQLAALGFSDALLPIIMGQALGDVRPDTPLTQARRTADVIQREAATRRPGDNRVIAQYEDWRYPDGSSEYRYQDRAGNIHYRHRLPQSQGGGENRTSIDSDGHMQRTEWQQMSLAEAWRRAATQGLPAERSMTDAQRQQAVREGRLPYLCESVRDQQGRIIPGVCVRMSSQIDYYPTGHISTRRPDGTFQIDPEGSPSHTPQQIQQIIERARNNIRRHEAPLTARDWDRMRPGFQHLRQP